MKRLVMKTNSARLMGILRVERMTRTVEDLSTCCNFSMNLFLPRSRGSSRSAAAGSRADMKGVQCGK